MGRKVGDDLGGRVKFAGDAFEFVGGDGERFGVGGRADGGVELDLVGADSFDEARHIADAGVVGVDAEAEKDLQPEPAGVFVPELTQAINKSLKIEVRVRLVQAEEGGFVAGIQ